MTTAARGPGRNAPKRTYAMFGAFENLVVSGEQRAQRRQFKTVAIDPNVWSGRALQEVSSTWQIRSCINVSGL
jgi:hypothetical protein